MKEEKTEWHDVVTVAYDDGRNDAFNAIEQCLRHGFTTDMIRSFIAEMKKEEQKERKKRKKKKWIIW